MLEVVNKILWWFVCLNWLECNVFNCNYDINWIMKINEEEDIVIGLRLGIKILCKVCDLFCKFWKFGIMR